MAVTEKLIAVLPILYNSKLYEPGDELPRGANLEATWIKNKAAVIKKDTDTEAAAAKAKPVVAQPGIAGRSNSGNENDLAGRITKTPEREGDKPKKK